MAGDGCDRRSAAACFLAAPPPASPFGLLGSLIMTSVPQPEFARHASDHPARVAAIVVAAGRGRRFGGGDNKVLLPLAGKPIWRHAVEAMRRCSRIDTIVLVIRPEDRAEVQAAAVALGLRLVDGGAERVDSVRAGLDEIARLDQQAGWPATGRWVAVHDAARPLVPAGDVERVLDVAFQADGAILAAPVRGTIKHWGDAGDVVTVDRRRLWEALTPQVFRLDRLQAAYDRWRGRPVTDDAELVERSGFRVTLVPGSAENLKITHPEDLVLADAILTRRRGMGGESEPSR